MGSDKAGLTLDDMWVSCVGKDASMKRLHDDWAWRAAEHLEDGLAISFSGCVSHREALWIAQVLSAPGVFTERRRGSPLVQQGEETPWFFRLFEWRRNAACATLVR